MDKIIFKTDWLGSKPVFYNDYLGLISHNINDVIEHKNITFHPEGLNNYLDFGYSVFGQTPVENVKFLPHSSSIYLNIDGKVSIKNSEDPVDKWVGRVSHEDDVLHSIFTSVHEWEKQQDGEIIIPTSGGLDSRLLNICIQDKSRIRSFTYGLCYDQKKSFEVVYAKNLSKILNTKWEQIELGDYHKYIELWYNHFGISTHAHGMYQIEFYTKIRSIVGDDASLLSGIIGDAWAGGVHIPPPVTERDIVALSYSHGLRADSKYSRLSNQTNLLKDFWEHNKIKLQEPLFRLVWSMRFKIILLSYLLTIPKILGFKPWSPFLDENIAMGMATIPPHRRKDRIWQREFFQKRRLDFQNQQTPCDSTNTLNYQAIKQSPLSPLNPDKLKHIINPYYVKAINAKITSFIIENIKPDNLNHNDNESNKYYSAYLTLKPIEKLLLNLP